MFISLMLTSTMTFCTGTSNNIVQVTADASTPEHATVECQFLALPASCKVCYGVIPNCYNLTCLPSVPASTDGLRATVRILSRLESNLKYCYTAAAIVGEHGDEELVLVVQGSFSTGKQFVVTNTCT